MDEQETFKKAAETFSGYVGQVKDEQWAAPTPDADWTVRDLVQHVTYEHFWVADLLAGKTMAEVGSKYDGDILGESPKQVWDQAVAASTSSVAGADLSRTVDLSYGPTPAATYLHHMTLDTVIHAWDLAKAIGAGTQLDEALVAQVYQWFLPEAEIWRAGGALGPAVAVPDDASVQDKLLALSGRQP